MEHQDELDRNLSAWTSERDKFALQATLRDLPVPVAAVQTPRERIDQDVTTAAFGLWPEVDHSQIGPVRVDGLPVHFSDTDWHFSRAGPCLGEHNEKVLTEILGMSAADVAQLAEDGVI